MIITLHWVHAIIIIDSYFKICIVCPLRFDVVVSVHVMYIMCTIDWLLAWCLVCSLCKKSSQ